MSISKAGTAHSGDAGKRVDDADLFGICEIIGDTYERSLMQPCKACNGTGITPGKITERHLLFGLLQAAGARVHIGEVPGGECWACEGKGSARDEKAATEQAVKAARQFCADIFGASNA